MRALINEPSPEAAPMNIIVNEELKAYIDPLTPEEYEALERSIVAEGCSRRALAKARLSLIAWRIP